MKIKIIGDNPSTTKVNKKPFMNPIIIPPKMIPIE